MLQATGLTRCWTLNDNWRIFHMLQILINVMKCFKTRIYSTINITLQKTFVFYTHACCIFTLTFTNYISLHGKIVQPSILHYKKHLYFILTHVVYLLLHLPITSLCMEKLYFLKSSNL